MKTTKDKEWKTGRKVVVSTLGDERFEAFIPDNLPPVPNVELDKLCKKIEDANLAVGRLDGMVMSDVVPSISLFVSFYIKKEALLSSQIEGTQSTLSDLLLFKAEDEDEDNLAEDTREVINYIKAMDYGLKQLKDDFPISSRLIREMHSILLSGVRGKDKMPGEFRTSQNWIGGASPSKASYVPPPAHEVENLMSELEKFIHQNTPDIPLLVKAGMIHVQFESIHPFLDGNGRIGRLLITLLLCNENMLKEPILYLSYFFKTHRSTYYDMLQNVHAKNEWHKWIEFFLDGTIETSNQAIDAVVEITKLFNKNKEIIKTLGRNTIIANEIHEFMKENPIFRMSTILQEMEYSRPTIVKGIKNLMDLGIVGESTSGRRNKIFVYREYHNILKQGTEPIN